tara:strand:+ start:234 stop:362 length:129 start_codon:yes stop_codon:yes gene_type:complete
MAQMAIGPVRAGSTEAFMVISGPPVGHLAVRIFREHFRKVLE